MSPERSWTSSEMVGSHAEAEVQIKNEEMKAIGISGETENRRKGMKCRQNEGKRVRPDVSGRT